MVVELAAPEGYILINVLATQVVAGTNYAFLARNEEGFAIVTVYRDLRGNASVTHIAPMDVTDIPVLEAPLPEGLVGGWAVWDTGKPPMLPTEEAEIAYENAATQIANIESLTEGLKVAKVGVRVCDAEGNLVKEYNELAELNLADLKSGETIVLVLYNAAGEEIAQYSMAGAAPAATEAPAEETPAA